MEKIYLLSMIVAVISILPVACLLLGKSDESRTFPSSVVVRVDRQSFNYDDVPRIKALWWDEHFCGCENGRDVIVVAMGFCDDEINELKRVLEPVKLVKENELVDMLGKEKT